MNFAQAGIKLGKQSVELSGRLKAAPLQGVIAAARVVEDTVAGFMGGKTVEMRGVGPGGAKVGLRSKIIPGSNPKAIVSMTGPAHLLERDTPEHMVGTGATGDAHGQVMHFGNSQWATGPFLAGGSTGRHMFRDGVKVAEPIIERVFARAVARAELKAFGL